MKFASTGDWHHSNPMARGAAGMSDRAVIAVTSRLSDNWVGSRVATGWRRIITMRMGGDRGPDVDCGDCGCIHAITVARRACFYPSNAGHPTELAAEIDQTMAAGRTFVFVDVGANVGLFSRYAASYAGVNAFMPLIREPGNVTRLRFSVTQIRVPLFAHTDASSALRWPPIAATRAEHEIRPMNTLANRRLRSGSLRGENVNSIDALNVEGMEDIILVSSRRDLRGLVAPVILVAHSCDSWRLDLL